MKIIILLNYVSFFARACASWRAFEEVLPFSVFTVYASDAPARAECLLSQSGDSQRPQSLLSRSRERAHSMFFTLAPRTVCSRKRTLLGASYFAQSLLMSCFACQKCARARCACLRCTCSDLYFLSFSPAGALLKHATPQGAAHAPHYVLHSAGPAGVLHCSIVTFSLS